MTPEEIAQKRQKEKDLISLMIRFIARSTIAPKPTNLCATSALSLRSMRIRVWTAVLTLRQRRFAQNANRIAIAKRCALALKRS